MSWREQKDQMPLRLEGLAMCSLEEYPGNHWCPLVGAISVLGRDRANLRQAEKQVGDRGQHA